MWQSIFHFPLFPWLHFAQRGKFQSLALQTLFTGSHKTPHSQSPPPHSDLFSLVCPLWRSGVSAMQGARQSALYFTSLPNTFPFTLALSICHWGLPHGVDHVSRWWSRLSCSLLALSYFTRFYGLLQEKRCLTFSFFFFFLAARRMQLHLSEFECASRRLHRCLHGRALFPDPPSPTPPSTPAPIPGRLRSLSVMDPH